MKSIVVLLCLLAAATVLAQSPSISIGPNRYLFGRNLGTPDPSYNAVFDVTDPNVDATAVLQAALTQMGQNGGGKLHMAAGTYVLLRQIIIDSSNVQLDGEGIDKTILQLVDFAQPFPYAGMIRTKDTHDIIFSNFTASGNKDNQYGDNLSVYGRYGFYTESVVNLWFDYVKVEKFQEYGFDPHGNKDPATWGYYLTLTNCVSTFNNWDGFTLDMNINIRMENCFSYGNGRHGINIVTGSRNAIIKNNTVQDNGYYYPLGSQGCGITVQNNQEYGTANIELIGNQIINSKRAGICTNDSPNITSTNNNILNGCTCYNFVDTVSYIATNDVCTTKILYSATGTTTVLQNVPSPTFDSNVYLNGVTFNKLAACVGSSPMPASHMRMTYIVGYNVNSTYNIVDPKDSTTIIQKALNDAHLNGGGMVWVKAGVYPLTGTIVVSDQTHFRGDGVGVTVLVLKNCSDTFVSGTSGFVRSWLSYNVSITDMSIDGNKYHQCKDDDYGRFGIYAGACVGLTINNVETMRWQQSGIMFTGWAAGDIRAMQASITNSYSYDNDRYGVISQRADNVTVQSCTLYGNGQHGLYVNNTRYFDGLFNTAYSNGYGSSGCGFQIANNLDYAVNHNTLYSNFAFNNDKGAICLQNAAVANIATNYMNDSCICFNFGSVYSSVLVQENTCYGAKYAFSSPLYPLTPDNVYVQTTCTNTSTTYFDTKRHKCSCGGGGGSSPPSSTGGSQPPSSTGESQPPSSTGDSQPPSSTSDNQPPSSTGDSQPPSSTGDSQPPSSTGDNQPPSSTGDSQPPSSTGNSQPPSSTGIAPPSSTGGSNTCPEQDLDDDDYNDTFGSWKCQRELYTCGNRHKGRLHYRCRNIPDPKCATPSSSTGSANTCPEEDLDDDDYDNKFGNMKCQREIYMCNNKHKGKVHYRCRNIPDPKCTASSTGSNQPPSSTGSAACPEQDLDDIDYENKFGNLKCQRQYYTCSGKHKGRSHYRCRNIPDPRCAQEQSSTGAPSPCKGDDPDDDEYESLHSKDKCTRVWYPCQHRHIGDMHYRCKPTPNPQCENPSTPTKPVCDNDPDDDDYDRLHGKDKCTKIWYPCTQNHKGKWHYRCYQGPACYNGNQKDFDDDNDDDDDKYEQKHSKDNCSRTSYLCNNKHKGQWHNRCKKSGK